MIRLICAVLLCLFHVKPVLAAEDCFGWYFGNLDHEPDAEKAFECFSKQKNGYMTIVMLAKGEGVPADRDKARALLNDLIKKRGGVRDPFSNENGVDSRVTDGLLRDFAEGQNPDWCPSVGLSYYAVECASKRYGAKRDELTRYIRRAAASLSPRQRTALDTLYARFERYSRAEEEYSTTCVQEIASGSKYVYSLMLRTP